MKTLLPFLTLCLFLLNALNSQTINLNFPSVNGQVHALAVKGDTLFIGGDFIEVDEIPRKNLAALDLNTGNLLDWNPESDLKVDGIAVHEDMILVCGDFQNINNTPRNTLAAIHPETSVLLDWNPLIVFPGIPNMQLGRISDIAVKEDVIYIGGYFLTVNGTEQNHLAALDLQGNLLPWSPSLDIPLENLMIYGDLLYISGPFQNVNGQERLSFASFDLNTEALTGWNPQADNPGNSGAIVFPGDEDVYISGFFDNVAGTPRDRAARVNNISGDLFPWEVDFIDAFPKVTAFEKWDNQLFIGGEFILDIDPIVENLAAVDAKTGEASGWTADPDNKLNDLLVAGQKLIVGGNFTQISDENKVGLAVYDLETIISVEEIEEHSISVFPNPANNFLTIQFSDPHITLFELYDLNGILIKQVKVQGNGQILDLESLPSGLYNLVSKARNLSILNTELITIIRN